MAFVYRSQKESLFDNKKQDVDSSKPSSLSNEQSQLNGTIYNSTPQNQTSISPSKIMKGLPSLLRKDRSILVQPLSNDKQNRIFRDQKLLSVKINLQKSKNISSNYFFSSNVPRDVVSVPFKPLDKSLTCSQFNTSTIDQMSLLEQKKLSMTNYLSSNFVVNKNLVLKQERKMKDFRKNQRETPTRNTQVDKLLIDCSKQENSQIKRKCSPPHNVGKTLYNTTLSKIKSQKEKNQQRSPNKGQCQMRASLEMMNLSMKKCQTEKKLMKLHKGNLQSSFYKEQDSESSQEEIQVINDTPGPGAYNSTLNLRQRKSFRSRKQKFAKIFVSPLQRFKTQEVKYQEITYVNEQKPQKIHKNQVFLSKTPKFLPFQKKSNSPEPGSYNPRSSLQHDIVRNLLRNANIASFNSTLPRFNYEKSNITPGPGQYDVDSLQKARLEELKNQMSSCYKSQVQRCLDYCKTDTLKEGKLNRNVQGLGNKQLQKNVIHRRQQHFDSSEFFSPPAFLSGVDRFQQPLAEYHSVNSPAGIYSKTFGKQIKNLQPFNSSQQRKFTQKVGQGVGVGSYLLDKNNWSKKSYNVFFH